MFAGEPCNKVWRRLRSRRQRCGTRSSRLHRRLRGWKQIRNKIGCMRWLEFAGCTLGKGGTNCTTDCADLGDLHEMNAYQGRHSILPSYSSILRSLTIVQANKEAVNLQRSCDPNCSLCNIWSSSKASQGTAFLEDRAGNLPY